MLKCKDVAHKASDYLDHNLSGWQRFGVILHLIICHNCRRFIRHLGLVSGLIAARGETETDPKTVAEVLNRVNSPHD